MNTKIPPRTIINTCNICNKVYDDVISEREKTSIYEIANYVKNSINEYTRIIPNILLTKKMVQPKIHKYWGLSLYDESSIAQSVLNYYTPLEPCAPTPDSDNDVLRSEDYFAYKHNNMINLLTSYICVIYHICGHVRNIVL